MSHLVLRLSDGEVDDLGGEVAPLDTPLPRGAPCVVLLDLRTHADRALQRLERWRARQARVGVLVASDKRQRAQRTRALELGADDFILAPIDPEELHLRLARLRGGAPDAPISLQLTDCVVDLDARQVARIGGAQRLSPTEARLLAYLAARPCQTIDHRTLLCEVWGYDSKVRTRTLTVTMQRLRAKVEARSDAPAHLITVYGAGYRFQPLDAAPPTPRPSLSWPSLLDSRRTNLAPQHPRLRGRGDDVEAIGDRLERERRLWITGPVGCGRARLLGEVLASRARRLPGGAFIVSAGDSVDAWWHALVATLGMSPGAPDWDRLAWALQARGPLWLGLVQPPSSVRAALDTCTARAPELRVIHTGLADHPPPGAAVHRLQPLAEGDAMSMLADCARAQLGGARLPATQALRSLALALQCLPGHLVLHGALLGAAGPGDLAEEIAQHGPMLPAWRRTPAPVQDLARRVAASAGCIPAGLVEDPATLEHALRRGWLVAVCEHGGRRQVGVLRAARAFLRSLDPSPDPLVPPDPAPPPAPTWPSHARAAAELLDSDPGGARQRALRALEQVALDGRRVPYVRIARVLAEAHRRLGQLEEAHQVLRTALDGLEDLALSPDDLGEVVRTSCAIQAERGLPDAAEEALQHAVSRWGARRGDAALRDAIDRARRREAS